MYIVEAISITKKELETVKDFIHFLDVSDLDPSQMRDIMIAILHDDTKVLDDYNYHLIIKEG